MPTTQILERITNITESATKLQFSNEGDHLLLGFLGFLLVNLGRDKAHVLNLPVVADVAELSCSSVINAWRIG